MSWLTLSRVTDGVEGMEVDLAATVHRTLSSGSSHLTALADYMSVTCRIGRVVVRGAMGGVVCRITTHGFEVLREAEELERYLPQSAIGA